MTSARRLVARYRIAANPSIVRGSWANITGYANSLSRMAQAATELAELFRAPDIKNVTRKLKTFEFLVDRLESHRDWFRNYVEGSEPPDEIDGVLGEIIEIEVPGLDEISEMLEQSSFVRVLKRASKVYYRPVERAVNALFNWIEEPADEGLKDWARVEQDRLRDLDMTDVEHTLRSLSGVDPDSLEDFLKAKKWVKDLAEAESVEALKPLLENWEDEIAAIGDEDYLSKFAYDEAFWKGLTHLDGVIQDIDRNTGRLIDLIFPE